LDTPTLIVVAVVAFVLIVAAVVAVTVRRRHGRTPTPSSARIGATPLAGSSLRSRLVKTRSAIGGRLDGPFRKDQIEPSFWTDLEEALLAADVGVTATADLIDRTQARRPSSGPEARSTLEAELIAMLDRGDRALNLRADRAVVLVVGVNGTGKTTSIAKLAAAIDRSGRPVVLAAADTFRAAAEDQLKVWGERIGVPVVTGGDGADPASVAFDALRAAESSPGSVVIVDTAGRLHSKANLMEELGKVGRVLRREAGGIDEVLLVLDGTTGQNAIAQARSFTEAVGVTGIIITKLDGTGRGGVVVAIEEGLGLPVKYIGVGEGAADLLPFDPKAFVEALLEP
jgi:fused signal recognition particle receptor